jgi:hypothetical protein
VREKLWPVRVAFFRGPDGKLTELLEEKTGYTKLSDANDRYCRSHFPSCKKIAGLTRMERAKPVN